MELKTNIPFSQLLQLVLQLTPAQKQKIKNELETEKAVFTNSSLKKLLLSGPVFTDEQIDAIEASHKSISEWRRK